MLKLQKDFDAFWLAYPRKVGKLAARRAFDVAVKKHKVTLQQLLDGIASYIRHKPEYADYAHPKTWLHQGRWMDEYDNGLPAELKIDWYRECQELHGGACGLSQMRHHHQKLIDAGKAAK